jgi:hypothetical protein
MEKVKKLYLNLYEFVDKVCEGRDETHGIIHMNTVTKNAMQILIENKEEKDINLMIEKGLNNGIEKELMEDVLIVGLLHDVSDHKYDKDGGLKKILENYLIEITEQNEIRSSKLMKIIEYISYSKENNALKANKPLDFVQILGEKGKNFF